MALLPTDFFSINRGGNPGNAASGAYYVSPLSGLTALIGGVSADAGNDLTAGADGKPYFQETVTALTYDTATTTLTYINEAGVTQTVNLSSLTTDVFVNGGSFNPATLTLTLTDNSGVTPDVVVPLSSLVSALADDAVAGTFTHTSGNGTVITVNKTGWMSFPVAP